MTNMQQTQLEARHNLITERIIATIDQGTNSELEEDTPLTRQKLQKVLGVRFIAAATKKLEKYDYS